MATVKRITDTAIRAAIEEREQGGQAELWLWDSELPGFGVRIAPQAATFIVKYAVGGGRAARQRKFKLGQFGALNSTLARSEAQAVLRRVARGEDPAGEREQKRNDPVLADLIDDFLTHHVEAKRKRTTALEYRRLVDKIIKPQIGKLRVKQLETADVSRLHKRLAKTPYIANRVLALISKFSNWSEGEGYRPKFSNPCRGVEKFTEKARERYLNPEEIQRLGKALAESDEWLTGIAAIRLLIFTGARHREITTLRWAQVDFERGIARLEDAKRGARNIQLPAPALEVLAALPRRADNPFVIWGHRSGAHLIGLQNIWERVREVAGLSDVRIHDLRHTHASIGVSGGASLRLVGAVLGHKSVLTAGRYAHVAPDPAKAVAEKVSGEINALLKIGAAK